VSDEGEIVHCRTIHRKPPENMWNKQLVLDIKGTPWNLKGGDAVMDHEVSMGRGVIQMKEPLVRAVPTVPREPLGQIGKRVYITKRMVDEFGATLGCRGCLEIGVPHTEECRARLTERLENAPEHAEKVKVADEKRRGLPGKRGACEIVDVAESAAKRSSSTAASSNEMPVEAVGPGDGIDVPMDDLVPAGAAEMSQLVSARGDKDWPRRLSSWPWSTATSRPSHRSSRSPRTTTTRPSTGTR
jgi:hypothetical protein